MSELHCRRLLVVAIAGLAFFASVGLAGAACPTRPLPPCDQVIFTGSVGPRSPVCVVTPHACPFRMTEQASRGLRGPVGATGAPGRSGTRGLAGAQGAIGVPGPAGATGLPGLQGVPGVMGALGLTGPVGAASTVPGPPGATGAVGAPGPTGATGADSTVAGPAGATGPAGPTGPTGASSTTPGPTGSTGPAGPAGPAGSTGPSGADSTVAGPAGATGATGPTGPAGGLAEYAYVYNVAGETVPLETAVSFDSNGAMTPGITHPAGAAGITVLNAGAYKVTFSVSASEPNQMSLFVNGVVVPGTTYGSGAGTQQNTGQAILTLAAGAVVTVVNHSSAAAVGLAALIGGTQATANASVTIEKLA